MAVRIVDHLRPEFIRNMHTLILCEQCVGVCGFTEASVTTICIFSSVKILS